MIGEVYFWHADQHWSLLQVGTIILDMCNQAYPKYWVLNLHIFAISPEKHGDELDFLPADKHESFLQVDSITFGVLSQTCPKYPKQLVQYCNISRKTWRMKLMFCLQINVKAFFKLILSYQVCVARYAQVIQNSKFAITSQYLKKGVNDKVDFHIDGDGQAFPKFPK